MAPDLPSTRTGRPDDSGADRIAQRTRWTARPLVVLASALAVMLAVALPSRADDLDDQKAEVNRQIAETRKQLNESTGELSDAVAALEKAQGELQAAQAELEATRAELSRARAYDEQMAAKLAAAQDALRKAQQAVAEGLVALEEQRQVVGEVAQVQFQQRTNLMGVGMLTENGSVRDLQTRVQYSTTLFDATESTMKKLEAIQRDLDARKAEQTRIEKQIAVDRRAAADNLQRKAELEAQASSQAAAVAELVASNAAAKTAAEKAVADDKGRYAELNSEREQVEKRIRQRIAEEEAAERRRIAAEKAAAEKAAAERAAAQKRAAQERAAQERAERERAAAAKRSRTTASPPKAPAAKAKAPSRSSKARAQQQSRAQGSSQGAGDSGSSAHHGFIYPVEGPITSPYGMRFHPVLKYWKLHDGTDFGVGCGTPIRAAYSGTVTEKYFNAGYGNRLLISHGRVDGRHVTTAYNHAIRYNVGVGQRVSKGQTIGYVGSTGYSTGCHLHLMVYLDGTMVNPMSWY